MSYTPNANLKLLPFQFGDNAQVPSGGTLQLLGAGQSTSGFTVYRAGTITAGSIAVEATSGNSYNLEIRVNGVAVATIALAAGNLVASSIALSAPVNVGDVVTAFMVRTSGSGGSGFSEIQATVEISSSV